MLLLVRVASAATYEVPFVYDTVSDALTAAGSDPDIEILIDPSATVAGPAVTVTDRTIAIRSADGRPALAPAMYFLGGSVTLENLEVRSAVTTRASSLVSYAHGVMFDGCDSATVDGLISEIPSGQDLMVIDTPADLGNLTLAGTGTGPALYILPSKQSFDVVLHDSTFMEVPLGAISAFNALGTYTVTLTIRDTWFMRNEGLTYSDIYAYNVPVTGERLLFTGGSAPTGNPLGFYSSSFSCTTCYIEGSTENNGKHLYVSGSGKSLELEDSWIVTADEPDNYFAWVEGSATARLDGVTVDMSGGASGLLHVSYADTTITGLEVLGAGLEANVPVIETWSSELTVSYTRMCGLAGVSALGVEGGTFSMQRSIIQGSDLDYAVELGSHGSYDNGTFSLVNNTFADVDGTGAVGGNIRGATTVVNNLFVQNDVAMGCSATPPSGDESYQLFYDNAVDVVTCGALDSTDLFTDPQLDGFDPLDCDSWPVPAVGSPVTDAGLSTYLDDDGTRADIGAIPAGGSAFDVGADEFDFGDGGAHYDTGVVDTGVVDTGVDTGGGDTGVDTGVVDTGDSDTAVDTGDSDTAPLDTGDSDTDTAVDTGDSDTDTAVDTGDSDTDTAVDTGDSDTDTAVDTGDSGTDTGVDTVDTGDSADSGTDTAVDTGDSDTGDSDVTVDTNDSDTDVADTGVDTGVADRDEDGSPDQADCDPDNAAVYPGAEDTPNDGVDADCNGYDTRYHLGGTCGCASSEGAPLTLALLAAGALIRRRRT